jgi:hypothetical protein
VKRFAEVVVYAAVVVLAAGALALFGTLPPLSLVTTLVYRGF